MRDMSDLSMNREPEKEHMCPMVDGTVDMKQMRQEQMRVPSGCSSL